MIKFEIKSASTARAGAKTIGEGKEDVTKRMTSRVIAFIILVSRAQFANFIIRLIPGRSGPDFSDVRRSCTF